MQTIIKSKIQLSSGHSAWEFWGHLQTLLGARICFWLSFNRLGVLDLHAGPRTSPAVLLGQADGEA